MTFVGEVIHNYISVYINNSYRVIKGLDKHIVCEQSEYATLLFIYVSMCSYYKATPYSIKMCKNRTPTGLVIPIYLYIA